MVIFNICRFFCFYGLIRLKFSHGYCNGAIGVGKKVVTSKPFGHLRFHEAFGTEIFFSGDFQKHIKSSFGGSLAVYVILTKLLLQSVSAAEISSGFIFQYFM